MSSFDEYERRLREIYESLTGEQLKIIDEYCKDNLKKLKKVCPMIMRNVCIDSNMDEDDLYDIAMEELVKGVYNYDSSKGKLETFLNNNISMKIKSYIRNTKYTYKRNNIHKDKDGKKIRVPNISLDEEPTEEGINLSEKIASDFEVENNLSEEIGFSLHDKIGIYSPAMQEYLRNLSNVQLKILELLDGGYTKEEIIETLHIDLFLYRDSIFAITSSRNAKKLRKSIRRSK